MSARWLAERWPIRFNNGMDLSTDSDILAAAPVVHQYVRPTPLYEWPALSQALGCRYFRKRENHR